MIKIYTNLFCNCNFGYLFRGFFSANGKATGNHSSEKRRKNFSLSCSVNLVLLIDIKTFISKDLFVANLHKRRKTLPRINFTPNKMIFYKPLLPEGCKVKIAFRDLG